MEDDSRKKKGYYQIESGKRLGRGGSKRIKEETRGENCEGR